MLLVFWLGCFAFASRCWAKKAPFPSVDCSNLNEQYCGMTCSFAQTDMQIALDFPGAEYQVDWVCGDLSARDLVTCWACDQTKIDMSNPFIPGTTPTVNATLQSELFKWTHVCDKAWTVDEKDAVSSLGQGQNGYPDGYACSAGSSGNFIKEGVELDDGLNPTSRTLVSGDGPTSIPSISSVPRPTLSGITTAPGPVNGDPPLSTSSLRSGGEGPSQSGGAECTMKLTFGWVGLVTFGFWFVTMAH